MQDVGWMRVKSDCYGPCADRLCPVDDRGDHHAMTAVDTVKVANRDDRWSSERFEFGDGASYLQGFGLRFKSREFSGCDGEVQLQPIVCKLHIRGEFSISGFMVKIVADVGEEGALWGDLFHQSNGVFQM